MSRQGNHIDRRRDGGWGWMIVLGAFLVNFTMLGLLRSGGIIYVALVDFFGISRREASWPFTLSGALMFITGPVAAFLSNYFSIRKIVIFGVTVASLGVTFCYFATDILTIIVLFGIVQGLGIGLMFTLNPVILNQYFTKRKATAMGIAYAGASLGSFALPPAAEILIDYYGLHGCFLILGGLSLNAIVGASLYRAPKFSITEKLKALTSQNHKEEEQHEEKVKSIVPVDALFVSNNRKINEDSTKEENSLMIENNEINGKLSQHNNNSIVLNDNIVRKMSVDAKHGVTKNAKLIAETISHPLFIILCMTMTIYFLSSHTFLMVIVDYSVDRGITDNDSVYLVPIYSITDLFGRLTIGWFSDSSKISRRHVVLFATIGLGISMEAIVFTWNYIWMAVVSAFLGLFSGCLMINYPPLMAEILGIDKLATAIGFAGLMIGCVSFTRPFLIGYFRDTFGVYDNMFHFFANLVFYLGLGIGLMFTLNPVILNQYFTKRKATAMGIAYAGASLGSFALPPAAEILIDYYGLHGCFLILGGLSLNAIVGASLYRAPKFSITEKLKALTSQNHKEEEQHEEKVKSIVPVDALFVSNNRKINEDSTKEENSLMIENNEINGKLSQHNNNSIVLNDNIVRKMSVDAKHGVTKNAKLIAETISHPLFIILCMTMTIYFLSSHTFLMVIVDYSVDRGITDNDSVYLVPIYSITDLFGRLTIGWFSDSSKISRRHVVLFATIGLGISMEAIVFTWNYIWMAVVSAFLGLFSGCLMINYPPLMAEILGIDKLATAIGFAGLMIGCVSFTRPFLIGYFRDTFGVYDNMFHFFASIHFLCSLLWILQPGTKYIFKKLSKKTISNNKIEIKF
ncbi:monocarboxylate transporter 9-like [Centruroides sculpturatus]|uniref:monocarboxylate transporter 9-like n=1 Tax=Centruroides sculpturatus TaxID=218467 RepID=UPI000C6D7A9A|nr:monocarboxylate transporter 9-like [Centruroides sculpturatus]